MVKGVFFFFLLDFIYIFIKRIINTPYFLKKNIFSSKKKKRIDVESF